MKKIILLILGLLIFVGCTSEKDRAKQQDLNKLESIGFTMDKAEAFYNFGNSSKIIFKEMENINNKFEQNSKTISSEDYKKITDAISDSKKSYKKLTPKNANKYFKYLDNNPVSSPLKILETMEQTGEKFTGTEAALMLNKMIPFAKIAIEDNNISGSKKKEAMEWYNNNNSYDGLFKYVFEY